jgi:predicted dithiol-disulfide oxidoreductase (DUF899 family)
LESLHPARFPGESDEYRQARNELLLEEIDLRRRIGEMAAKRSKLPLGGEITTDYEFEQWDPDAGAARAVRLSDLFEEGKDALFVYSFMIVSEEQGLPFVGPCPSCTSIIDAVDGELPHITRRINFAVSAKGPAERFHQHGQSRGWRNARLLSPVNGAYSFDYQAEDEKGNQWPLATVFVRRDGKIHHFWSSELWLVSREDGQDPRHVDFMWPMWPIFDRTPDGRGDFFPALKYG